MKQLIRVISMFGVLGLGSLAAAAQVTVIVASRPIVHRPPIVLVRPVAVFPGPVAYRPVLVPRPYYPVARRVVVYRRPMFVYRAGPVHRAYWRHERWEYRHDRW
ncbi:MAG: hypothetical protein ACM3JB_16605 [Acidobacteriaceae bacterium]